MVRKHNDMIAPCFHSYNHCNLLFNPTTQTNSYYMTQDCSLGSMSFRSNKIRHITDNMYEDYTFMISINFNTLFKKWSI